MITPSIADYLKYANLQMAAEAFLTNADGTIKADIPQALKEGNFHSSKFTESQANKFSDPVEGWTVLDQCANTASGFSGTLFRNNQTGELVVSFRSTEFIDDAVRDNLCTNTFEIKNTGYAWGQIADMEAWYAKLNADSNKLAGKNFSITGYSLGGHLATAFNLLREEDGTRYRVDQVVTFNGAGVGKFNEEQTLHSALQAFRGMRDNTDAIVSQFGDPALGELYRKVQQNLQPKGSWTIARARKELQTYHMPEGVSNSEQATLTAQLSSIGKALNEMEELLEEKARLLTLIKGGDGGDKDSKPKEVPLDQIAALDLNYRMAVQFAAARAHPAPLSNGLEQAFGEKAYFSPYDGVRISNQFDVVADCSPSAVAHSQWHIGTDVRCFVEDQPLYRGGIVGSVFGAAWDYGSIKLLVDNYAMKDFGDTHSLVLLVDSLNTQNLLLQLVAPDQRPGMGAILNDIFRNASYLRKESDSSGQGKSEGNVLENILDPLGCLLLGPEEYTALLGNPNGNTWSSIADKVEGETVYAGRESFYKVLKEIAESPAYTGLAGKLTISASSATLKGSARTDFGAFVALYSLSPFYVKVTDTSIDL